MSAQHEFKLMVESELGTYPLKGIEIGTASGIWTEYVLRNMNIWILVTIDPYLHFPGEAFEGGKPQEWHNKIKASADKKLKNYHNVKRLEMTSAQAFEMLNAEVFRKGLWDFVYIDGNHNKEYIQHDVNHYYNLVRENGIFAGHDWNLAPVETVKEAFNGRLHIIEKERIWWVKK